MLLQRKLTRHIEEVRASRVLSAAKAAVAAAVPGSVPHTRALRSLAHLRASDRTWLLAPALVHIRMSASHYRILVRRFLRLALPVCNYADGAGSSRPARSASNVANPTHDLYGDFTLSDFRAVGQAQWVELHDEVKHFFFRAAKQAGITSVSKEKRADLATSMRRPGDIKIGSTRHGWKAASGKTLLIDFTTISSVCATVRDFLLTRGRKFLLPCGRPRLGLFSTNARRSAAPAAPAPTPTAAPAPAPAPAAPSGRPRGAAPSPSMITTSAAQAAPACARAQVSARQAKRAAPARGNRPRVRVPAQRTRCPPPRAARAALPRSASPAGGVTAPGTTGAVGAPPGGAPAAAGTRLKKFRSYPRRGSPAPAPATSANSTSAASRRPFRRAMRRAARLAPLNSLNDGKLYGVDLRLRNKAEGVQLAVSLLPYGALRPPIFSHATCSLPLVAVTHACLQSGATRWHADAGTPEQALDTFEELIGAFWEQNGFGRSNNAGAVVSAAARTKAGQLYYLYESHNLVRTKLWLCSAANATDGELYLLTASATNNRACKRNEKTLRRILDSFAVPT
jgi:hypothetical protein